MTNVSLSVFDRLTLTGVLAAQQGDLLRLRVIFRLLDALELREEEAEEIGLESKPDGRMQWRLDAPDKEIEFSDADLAVLKEIVSAKNDWLVDRRIVEMLDRLGV